MMLTIRTNGGIMRTAIRSGVAAGLLLLATACGKSTAEMEADCKAAITKESTLTNRPEACEGLSQASYDALQKAWLLDNFYDSMPKAQRDLIDLRDDGELNNSIGDGN